MVLGYAATAQAQVNSSQQNGSRAGEWFNSIFILSTLFCFILPLIRGAVTDNGTFKSITEIRTGTGAPQAAN